MTFNACSNMPFTRLMMDQNVLRALRFRINIVSVLTYLMYTYHYHVVRYIFQVVCHAGNSIYFPSSSRKVSHQYVQEETDFRYKRVELN